MIPLTRAIDTLIIHIEDSNSNIGKILRKIYSSNNSIMEWHKV